MDQIEERAPPKPQTSRWKEITARNTAQYKARRAPLHKRAFKGLQPDPRRTSGVDARYSRTAAHGGRRAHGGTRRNLLRWGSALLRGIADDDAEQVLDALAMPSANVHCRVTGGAFGAPFDYAGDALVSVQRIQREVDKSQKLAHDLADKLPRYYSAQEWANIEASLREISTYFPPTSAIFEVCRVGDSALHLAVRHGAFGAAKILLSRGCDPIAENDEGHTVAYLLGERFKVFEEMLRQADSHADAAARRDARRKVDNARDDIRAVANAVIDRLEERDEAVMAPLAFKKWQLQIEGEDLDRKDQATLDQRAKLQQELEVAHDIAHKTKADARSRRASKATSARALFRSRDERKATLRQRATSSAGAPARHYETAYSSARDFEPGERRSRGSVSFSVGHYYQNAPSAFERGEARRRAGPPSLSDVSEGFFDDIDVNDWLMDLDHAAVLVQANWRAIACRQALLRAVRHASAAAIQTRYREHRRAMWLWDAALGRRKRGYY